jgi:hypothetical protein
MPNNKKIVGEIEVQVRELILAGHNAYSIGKKFNLSKETVLLWANNNELQITKRTNPELEAKYKRFPELIRAGKTLTEARKELGIHPEVAQRLVKKYKLESCIRTRAEAALDKILSLEEATNRLPIGSGTVTAYDQTKGKYFVIAPDGFIYHKTSAKLYQGDPRGKGGVKLTEDFIIHKLASIGYEFIIGSFTIKRKPLKAKHLKCGNIREARLGNFESQDCATCANTGVSKEETELNDFVKSLGLETIKYKFKERITRPQEIDVYSKETGIGIEYCGLYHHGERAGKDRNYHKNKLDMAIKENVQLLTVFSNEWLDRKDQVKGFIRSKLGKNETTVFARKTELKQLGFETARNFLDSYHIQGSTRIQACFGLFFNGELVAVVSGAEHHRVNGQFTLNRLCFKHNVSVVGGASRLNKALCSWAKNKGYRKIVTWSDNRWSLGTVYSAMGYTKEEELGPDYFYNSGGVVKSKQSCQKKHLIERGAIGNTEKEMALSLGYDRVWDCGKIRWIMDL